MIPVDQTIFGSPNGNCYSACLASILELPLEEVPNFCVESDDWLVKAESWLRIKHEFMLLGFCVGDNGIFYCIPSTHHIIAGNSPRGIRHTVVGFQGKMIHDPHPSRAGLLTTEEFEFLIPIR